MSQLNGDKSRYGRLRKQKLLRRKKSQEFQQLPKKTTETKPAA